MRTLEQGEMDSSACILEGQRPTVHCPEFEFLRPSETQDVFVPLLGKYAVADEYVDAIESLNLIGHAKSSICATEVAVRHMMPSAQDHRPCTALSARSG